MSGDRRGRPPPSAGRRVRSTIILLVCSVGVALFIGYIGTLAGYAIWPGEVRIFEGWICPDTHPEVFVVHETYAAADGGTAVEDTAACLDERGDVVERGYGYVVLRLGLVHSAISLVVLVSVGRAVARRAASRTSHA